MVIRALGFPPSTTKKYPLFGENSPGVGFSACTRAIAVFFRQGSIVAAPWTIRDSGQQSGERPGQSFSSAGLGTALARTTIRTARRAVGSRGLALDLVPEVERRRDVGEDLANAAGAADRDRAEAHHTPHQALIDRDRLDLAEEQLDRPALNEADLDDDALRRDPELRRLVADEGRQR